MKTAYFPILISILMTTKVLASEYSQNPSSFDSENLDRAETLTEKIINQIDQIGFENKLYLEEINTCLSEKLSQFKKSLDLESENYLEHRANQARALYFSMTVFTNSIQEINSLAFKKLGINYSSYNTDFYDSWSKTQLALGECYFVRDDLIQASNYVRKFHKKGIPVIETVMQNLLTLDEHFVEKVEIASVLFLLENFKEYVSLSYYATFSNNYIKAPREEIVSHSFDLTTTIPRNLRRLMLFAAPLRFNNFRIRNFDNLAGIGGLILNPWLETIAHLSKEMEQIFEEIDRNQKQHPCCVLM